MHLTMLSQSLIGATRHRAAHMTALPLRLRSYGNLKDQDRIFTNVYKDEEPWIESALKRGDWH